MDIGSVVRQGTCWRRSSRAITNWACSRPRRRWRRRAPRWGCRQGEDDRIELERVTAVKQAKAVLEEATKNRERVKSLSVSGIASQSEVDTVEAAYTVALARYDTALEEARARMATVAQRRAEFELARKRLADASVRAPFDGAVQARPASVGEYVAAGTPIVQLVKTDPLRLRLEVPERECILVRTGPGGAAVRRRRHQHLHAGRSPGSARRSTNKTACCWWRPMCPGKARCGPGLFARAQIIVTRARAGVDACPPRRSSLSPGWRRWWWCRMARRWRRSSRPAAAGRTGWRLFPGLEAGETVVLNPGGLRTGQPVSGQKRAGAAAAPAGGEAEQTEPSATVTDAKAR